MHFDFIWIIIETQSDTLDHFVAHISIFIIFMTWMWRILFIGTYQHNIDAKGRVIMPAKFREELGEAFYVTKGLNDCLFVLSSEQWDNFMAKLSSQPMSKVKDVSRFFCAGAEKAVPNAQGRILIPDHLRKYAALDKEVTVIGTGNRVEIWNTDKWNNFIDSQSQTNILEAMELLEL